MEFSDTQTKFLDHIIQSKISEDLLLEGTVITCAKNDEKYVDAPNRIEEEFPEHIIGCRDFKKDKKIVSVTSRNVLTIRQSKNLNVESRIQCDYFATSICSLILGESLESLHVFFGSVIGDLIDWQPNREVKPMMRKGHKGMIFSIVTDSTRLFTISDDRTIRMWSIGDRESGPICTVFGHTARPFAICVDPSQRAIYTGGIEQTLFCWNYDDHSISISQKIAIACGVIRKITKSDCSRVAVSTQNGDLLDIHVPSSRCSELKVLKENVKNFWHLREKLVVLTESNELILYENIQMDKILFRCGDMKHMVGAQDSVVVWHQDTLVVITHLEIEIKDMGIREGEEPTVHRLKLSMNIITATCYENFVVLKTIDGNIQIYDFTDAKNIRCINQWRPRNPSMIPAVISLCDNLLVIGTTHGELYHTNVKNKLDDVHLSLSHHDSYELFGGKEVTCIFSLFHSNFFMTLGKTGVWGSFKITTDNTLDFMNSRTFSAASRVAWPSQIIEWNKNQDLLIAGFYGTSLTIWNSSTGLPVYDVYCGGGHRIWQLTESTVYPQTLYFDFIRDSELCRYQIDTTDKKHLISTAHSSPIVAASGSVDYLTTVSLDGHLSIADGQGNLLLTTFVGENLLCTDVYQSDSDEVFVLAGGGKSKLSLLKFLPSDLRLVYVFWQQHVVRPDEGRIVAVKSCRLDEHHLFHTASYSSGVLEVFRLKEEGVKKELESVSRLEIEDELGIATKIDFGVDKRLYVGTSGSYVLAYNLEESGELIESKRLKLSDRSGITAIATSSLAKNAVYVGCDSGHVYKCHMPSGSTTINDIHNHLSTVVGIVVDKNKVLSTSLDCVILKSTITATATANQLLSTLSRKPITIDMPNGMVRTGKSTLAVVGDGIQRIENLF